MQEPRQKYNEPVFYFNPNGNCFLDAEFITESSIILNPQSALPNNKGKIEFSFPNCDYVISCNFDLIISDERNYILRFKNLKNEDREFIARFIFDQNSLTKTQLKPEAVL
ncbi:MAG: hypothetical protein HUU56_10345 [Bdellovibrionaceae bacterium]|nr:hypothetical protein [Pseudobdellovibrionaceae bacterium]